MALYLSFIYNNSIYSIIKKLDQTSKYENMKDVECVGVKPTNILKENFLFKIYNVEKFNNIYAKFIKSIQMIFYYYIKYHKIS